MEVLPAPDGAVMMMILLLIAMCKEKEFSRRLRRWIQMKFGHTCPNEFVQAGIIQMDTDLILPRIARRDTKAFSKKQCGHRHRRPKPLVSDDYTDGHRWIFATNCTKGHDFLNFLPLILHFLFLLFYSPLNTGLLFSKNALIPSL